MGKHLFALVLSSLLFTAASVAQKNNFFIAPGIGGGYYVGDLKEDGLPDFNYINPGGSLKIKYKYANIFTVSVGYTKTTLSGADSLSANVNRGLAFKSSLDDFALMFRLNLGGYRSTFYSQHRPISMPAVLLGVSYFRFNPKVNHRGDWIEARELGTEGQLIDNPDGTAYNIWEPSLKTGLGFSIYLTHKIDLDFFGYYSFTFTDKLDDVGGFYPDFEALQETPNGLLATEFAYRGDNAAVAERLGGQRRGNPDSNDGFYYFGVDFSYRITDRKYRRRGPRRGSRPRF